MNHFKQIYRRLNPGQVSPVLELVIKTFLKVTYLSVIGFYAHEK